MRRKRPGEARAGDPRVALIGPGRVGIGLARALLAARVPLAGLAARTAASARRRSRLCPASLRPLLTADACEAMSRASITILCVPDARVESAARDLARRLRRGSGSSLPLRGRIVLHTSASTPIGALAPLAGLGAGVGLLHPLLSFPPAGLPIDLAGVHAGVGGDPAARRSARALARRLGMIPFPMPAGEAAAAYHLAASLAANGLVGLLDVAIDLATRRAGLSPRRARKALVALARSALHNVARSGQSVGLTGPVARGDASTVAAHLEALAAEPASTAALYRILARRALRLARRSGRLPPGSALRIARLLSS